MIHMSSHWPKELGGLDLEVLHFELGKSHGQEAAIQSLFGETGQLTILIVCQSHSQ